MLHGLFSLDLWLTFDGSAVSENSFHFNHHTFGSMEMITFIKSRSLTTFQLIRTFMCIYHLGNYFQVSQNPLLTGLHCASM